MTKQVDIRARLDEIKARADAATEGPWDSEYDNDFYRHAVFAVDSGPGTAYIAEDLNQGENDGEEDAEFIAHARTDVDDMAAALTAVLDLHKKERRYLPYEGADVSYDTPEEAVADMEADDIEGLESVPYFDLCAHCRVIEDSPCDGQCTREAGYLSSLYPCPTVTAITEKLGGDRG